MKTHIMLDLETLGTKPGSVIVSIGAVKFNNYEITSSFYERIDPESCVAVGLKIDIPTVMWWLQQENAARLEITKPGKNLCEVLNSFAVWVGCDEVEVWGNGAAFDNVLLSNAYTSAGVKCPWNFWNDRCYRTIKNMHPEVPMRTLIGTHHNALDDAKTQTLHLMDILNLKYSHGL